jgi:hypothetical protein
MAERVLTSTPFCRASTENVCPYGIIRTNRKTLALQRVDWFVLILFPLKPALEWGLREGGEKLELHLKDKFSKDCIGYEWITKHYRDRLAYIMFPVEFIYLYKTTMQSREYEFWGYHLDLK